MTVDKKTTQQTAKLMLGETSIDLPVLVGSEDEYAVDISALRKETGYITLDPGYGNTGSVQSGVTFIDGEKGILRYRGYPIEEIADKSTFTETALLLINGELPTQQELVHFRNMLTRHELLHEGLRAHFEGFPPYGHPMAILSAMINASSCYHPELLEMENDGVVLEAAAKLMSKVRTMASFAYKQSIGQPVVYPDPNLSYCRNFLHMMFSLPNARYEPEPEVVRALSLFYILHADHEQNCSASTVRMVGSAGANLFASVSAGVCALWGPLHGGANTAVIRQLQDIYNGGTDLAKLVEEVKDKSNPRRLMGFGHRVYKNYDPRARILKQAADELLEKMGRDDPLLEIAEELEDIALHDDYFIQRGLYPNVDFYSGIILRAIGIPLNMFTVMFAIGRMPGWIAHWYEQFRHPARISRPRQVYIGSKLRKYMPIHHR